jgi:hypothetical protein
MMPSLCFRWRGNGVGALPRDPAQRQIDPPAIREQARGAGINPIDAMERKTGVATKHKHISRG